MKEFILVILILVTIGFCIVKICETIMYNKFLKQEDKKFGKIFDEALEMALEEMEKEESEKKKKATRKSNKKTIKKEKENK